MSDAPCPRCGASIPVLSTGQLATHYRYKNKEPKGLCVTQERIKVQYDLETMMVEMTIELEASKLTIAFTSDEAYWLGHTLIDQSRIDARIKKLQDNL